MASGCATASLFNANEASADLATGRPEGMWREMFEHWVFVMGLETLSRSPTHPVMSAALPTRVDLPRDHLRCL